MAVVNWSELLFANRADYTAYASSNSEGTLLSGVNIQPALPPQYFDARSDRKTLRLYAAGVLSVTGTPTIIFQVRLGSTVGSSNLAGASVGVSAAITTQSGVTNQRWELELFLTCNTPGLGSGNTTLNCHGHVLSPGGFASPFIYNLEPTTPETATWTQTVDGSVALYFNVSATWSANSALNTATLKHLLLQALN